jgi:tetratricopeptide (TPR) repeat protein
LQRVLASASLQRSPQLQRFLCFIVDEKLAGRGDRLKEYVLGVEIFGRPASYDPRLDSLVRVEARRLRTALESYYGSAGIHDPIVIELQRGSYVPSIRSADAGPANPPLAAQQNESGGGPESRAEVDSAGYVTARTGSSLRRFSRLGMVAVSVITVVLATAAVLSFRSRPAEALTDRDSIVLADFVNATGDPLFDDALKQGLTMELEQSPFLNLVSDRRTGQALKLMGRSGTERLGQELAREVCLRTESKAAVAGKISRLGSEYVIGLTATNCSTGDSFAHVQVQAENKEHVLKALKTAAVSMRSKLGESLISVQRFDIPVEEATTSSLEALQAYSLGRRVARERGSPSDIPFYKRAIEIDPNFAVAYAALGVSYVNLAQPSAATAYLNKAYELRDRVSEREKYRISAYYYHVGTGEVEKAIETYELWKRSYPRDFAPYINLGLAHTWQGQYEKSVTETKEALRLEPNNVLPYSNLAAHYIKLGRSDEAKAVLDQALARNLTSKFVRQNLCMLAFLGNDALAMQQQLADVQGKPGDEDPLLSQQSDTEAYYGRLQRAREFSRRAVDSAIRAGNREAAAGWLVNEGLREAEFGNAAAARKEISKALQLSPGRDVVALAALGLARAGDSSRALALLRDLQKNYPLNTMIAVYWAPTIGAAIEINKGQAAPALELLQKASPYELGSPPPMGLATMYPVYLRGEAYLLLRRGAAAAAEAQKILDHPGLVLNFPLHALSHLQLGRARALTGDVAGARRAYDDFLGLWKDADSEISIFRQARTEYRKLR